MPRIPQVALQLKILSPESFSRLLNRQTVPYYPLSTPYKFEKVRKMAVKEATPKVCTFTFCSTVLVFTVYHWRYLSFHSFFTRYIRISLSKYSIAILIPSAPMTNVNKLFFSALYDLSVLITLAMETAPLNYVQLLYTYRKEVLHWKTINQV